MGKTFELGDILSVTTGRLLSHRTMDGLYEILNYMTGDNLYTHQLPRASDECAPWLLRRYPQLAGVEPPEKFRNQAHVWEWLTEQEGKYGNAFDVEPIPNDDHAVKDPVSELIEIRRKLRPDDEDHGVFVVDIR
jgi:hypothetical protein